MESPSAELFFLPWILAEINPNIMAAAPMRCGRYALIVLITQLGIISNYSMKSNNCSINPLKIICYKIYNCKSIITTQGYWL